MLRSYPLRARGAVAATAALLAAWAPEIAAQTPWRETVTVTAAAESGPKAFKMAGLKPPDVKMLSLYDAFTFTPILFLEDLGYCPKGEGGRFVANGAIAPGGKLAVNTSGGGLSYCHPGMYGLLVMIEAIRQVRGECDKRQVKNCDISLAHGNGGVLSSQCTVIFGSQATV